MLCSQQGKTKVRLCTEGKRKEKEPGQIGLVLRLFLQRLLQLARLLKKWPSTNDLEESSG